MTNQELKRLKYLRRVSKAMDHEAAEVARKECERLEAFIKQIPDEVTRNIFYLHYVKGWTWQRVASFYGWKDESWPRKLTKKFLE